MANVKAKANKTYTDAEAAKAHKLFLRNLGSGSALTKHLLVIMVNAVETADTTPIANLMVDCRAKDDMAAVRSIWQIVQCVWPGAEMLPAAKAKGDKPAVPARIKTKGIRKVTNAISGYSGHENTGLTYAAKSGLSLRGNAVVTACKKPENLTDAQKAKRAKTRVMTSIDRLAASAFKADVTEAAALAAFKAAYEKAKKEAAAKEKS